MDVAAEDRVWLGDVDVDVETHERRVQFFLEQERAKREARRRLDTEGLDTSLPPFETLRARRALPRAPILSRIENWQPQGSRVMVAAQYKTGKTTLVGNTIRSLVDGDLFLGRDVVTPITGTVVDLDFEMGQRTLDDWLDAQQIQHDDRVLVVSLRGRAASFNPFDLDNRAHWVRQLQAHECAYLIVDCLRPVLDALGLDEHKDAGRFLVAFDALLREAGIPEAMVVHHMGHNGERSRGDSRIRDWPDQEWRLIRKDEEPSSPRFITAYGRDVDVPESQLEFTLEGRRLTISGGSRRDAANAEALEDVLVTLSDSSEPLSGRAIEDACKKAGSRHSRDKVRAAVAFGIRRGDIIAETGARNAILHRVRECAAVRGQCAGAVVSECADPYKGPRAHSLLTEEPSARIDGPVTSDGKPFVFDGKPFLSGGD